MQRITFKIATLLLLLNIFSGNLSAQMLTVSSSFERDSVLIGEQLVYSITVTKDPDIKLEFPLYSDTLTQKLEIISDLGTDTLEQGGKVKLVRQLKVTAFEPGLLEVPSQAILFSGNGWNDTVFSSPAFLRVYAPQVDTSRAIMPIHPPVNTPVNIQELLPWTYRGLLILLLVSLVIALVWIYLHKDRVKELIKPVKLEPAHIIAFRELDRLKDEKLPEKGMVKDYYTRLTEIVRRYIEHQYGIPAMETTTWEILRLFAAYNPDDQMLDEMLKDLLELGDLVKFAKQDPAASENQTNLNNAYLFVQKTYPFFIEPGLEEQEKTNEVDNEETVSGDE